MDASLEVAQDLGLVVGELIANLGLVGAGIELMKARCFVTFRD